jgi:Co/Zn/Cd efflux system component
MLRGRRDLRFLVAGVGKGMSDSCCGGDLGGKALQAGQRRVLRIVLAINIATFLMVVGAAIYSGSSSLLSSALDNFGDALTYALSLAVVGGTLANKSRVAFVKAALIMAAAIVVAGRIVWGVANPGVPIVEVMSVACVLNLIANIICLRLLTPYRHGDVNLASAWECSRNDVFEGLSVFVAAAGVWLFASPWPDLIVAAILLILFGSSAVRVFRAALLGLRAAKAQST